MNKKAFTLIELLIVVAIIAILAAIAVPNFLEAQVRSKVSRARADMRSTATALEAYAVDYNNKYPLMRSADDTVSYLQYVGKSTAPTKRTPQDIVSPPGTPDRNYNTATIPLELTTPVSYITSTLKDPFKDPSATRKTTAGAFSATLVYPTDPTTMDYTYHNIYQMYITQKSGGLAQGFTELDIAEYGQWRLISLGPDKEFWGSPGRRVYDATNGTTSKGDIIRTQNSSSGDSKESTSGSN